MNLRSVATRHCPTPLRPLLDRIAGSSHARRLARGAFWSAAGTILSHGLMLCATVVVARILGKNLYGELGMIKSTVGTFGAFAGFALSLTATKHVAEFRETDPVRAGRIVGLSSLMASFTGGFVAVLLFVFAPWLAEHTIDAPHLADTLRIGALILFLTAITGAQNGALSGFEAFKAIAYVNFIVGLASFPTLVIAAFIFGLPGVVWALAINLAIRWALGFTALRQEARRHDVPISFQGWTQEVGILWRFSLPAVLGTLLVSPAMWVCNAMLANQPDGYSQLGLFSAVLVFSNLMMMGCQMLTAPLLPIMTNAGDAAPRSLDAANVLISWSIGLFPCMALLCLPELFEMLFGQEYAGYSLRATAAIVLFYTCIMTYRVGLMRALQSKGLLWLGFANNLFYAAVLVSSCYFLVPWGAGGLAGAVAISHVAGAFVFVPLYLKYCRIPARLLLSKEVFAIWAIVAGLLAAVLYETPLLYRAMAMPLCIAAAGLLLLQIWTQNTRQEARTAQ